MKVLYLFNGVIEGTEKIEKIEKNESNDNSFLGMFRIRKYGIETNFLEIEQFLPFSVTNFLRRHFLNIWWVHLPLFPLFFRYDVVVSSTAYGTLLVKSLLHIKKPKWVMVDFNITGTIGQGKTMRQKVFKWAVSRCDGIVAISEAEEKSLKAMFPHLAQSIIFLHEGVDSEYYKPSLADTKEEDYILSVGLDPSRDFRTLIEAAKEFSVTVKLATKPEMVKCFEPLPPNVSAKKYSRSEMPDLYAKAKIVVNSLNIKENSNDSMGTFSVADAMAMEKAVIVTRTNSMQSYIEDGKTAVFVPPRNPKAMRDAILNLLRNENKRKEIGKNAREFIVNNVDAELFAKNLAEYLKKIQSK
jgi:glycosyltransferase involved in cell wall biosynthesis